MSEHMQEKNKDKVRKYINFSDSTSMSEEKKTLSVR